MPIRTAADLAQALLEKEESRIGTLFDPDIGVEPENEDIVLALDPTNPDNLLEKNQVLLTEALSKGDNLHDIVIALQDNAYLTAFQNAGLSARQGRLERLRSTAQETLELTQENGPFLKQLNRIGVVADSDFKTQILTDRASG